VRTSAPAGDRAFSHVFREGAADIRFAARGQVRHSRSPIHIRAKRFLRANGDLLPATEPTRSMPQSTVDPEYLADIARMIYFLVAAPFSFLWFRSLVSKTLVWLERGIRST